MHLYANVIKKYTYLIIKGDFVFIERDGDFYQEFSFALIENKSESFTKYNSEYGKKLPFYLNSMGISAQGEGFFTDRIGLDEFFVCYTLEGEGALAYRGKNYILKPGTLFFLDCFEHQVYQTQKKPYWRHWWVHMNGYACRNFYNLIFENGWYIFNLRDTSELFLLYERLKELLGVQILANDLEISITLQKLLSYIANTKIHDSVNLGTPEWVIATLNYVSENLINDISLDALTKISNYSVSHFIRNFKKYTGFSPYDYLILQRISYAKQLIINTNHSIEVISNMVNFSNTSRFIIKFKELTGLTPLKYRKDNTKN